MTSKFFAQDFVALADHVTSYNPAHSYVSTFNAAIREARSLTARDLTSGAVTKRSTTTLWSGTFVYLTLLEQVGKSLRPRGARRTLSNSNLRPSGEKILEKAIRQFAPTAATPRERQVLYALRCAFAHEFGLFNKGNGKPPYCRVFRLDDDPSGKPLVKPPSHHWNGRFTVASVKSAYTTVNLIGVADVAEQVIQSVRAYSNRVALRSEVPIAELPLRFGFQIK